MRDQECTIAPHDISIDAHQHGSKHQHRATSKHAYRDTSVREDSTMLCLLRTSQRSESLTKVVNINVYTRRFKNTCSMRLYAFIHQCTTIHSLRTKGSFNGNKNNPLNSTTDTLRDGKNKSANRKEFNLQLWQK